MACSSCAEARQLYQKGDVIDERERELPRGEARRRAAPDFRFAWAMLGAARSRSAQQVQPSASGAGVRIEKIPAVAMVREPTVVRRTARLRSAGERRTR